MPCASALGLTVLAAWLLGCGAQPPPDSGTKAFVDDPHESMSPEPVALPAGVEIRREPRLDTIRFLKGANLSASLDDDPAFQQAREAGRFDRLALMFVRRHRDAFRIDDPASELAVVSTTSDGLGMTHVKLQQRYDGLPVEDAELIVHLNAAGQVTLVNGAYRPTPTALDTSPALSAEAAREAAAREVGIEDCRRCPTELVVFAPEGGEPRLAYRIETEASLSRWQLMVSADDGEILRKLPTALQGAGPGPTGLRPE